VQLPKVKLQCQQPVQLWTACLEELQRLQDGLEDDKPAPEASVAKISSTMRIAEQLPAILPATTWDDLILHHKVC